MNEERAPSEHGVIVMSRVGLLRQFAGRLHSAAKPKFRPPSKNLEHHVQANRVSSLLCSALPISPLPTFVLAVVFSKAITLFCKTPPQPVLHPAVVTDASGIVKGFFFSFSFVSLSSRPS